jgi:hypothetical protein
MHGIYRKRDLNESSQSSYEDINRVVVRYADGRTLNFIPEAGRENFSEDDMLELKKILTRASSTAEWAEVGESSGG